MLGRLEMGVDDCITEYCNLASEVFGEKLSAFSTTLKGKVKARFDSTRLESAVQKVIRQSGIPETSLFSDGTERGCRT
jgi:hypothetical protein